MIKIKLPELPGFKKFQFKKPAVVIEIGNDWVKIAQSSPSQGGTISKIGFIKLADIEGSVAVAILKAFKGLGLDKSSVTSYIPRHLATVRILELPSTDPAEIREMVGLQVGKQTPYSKEEISSAYKIIGSAKEGYTKIMLVIVRQTIVADRLKALREAGIETERVSLSTEGVYNWLTIAYPEAALPGAPAMILLDIDSNYSDFIIVSGGKLSFTRNILIGSNQLIDERDKWQDKFIEELKHSLELYQNEDRDAKVTKILLSGAAKNISYLDAALTGVLDMPVESADPLKNFKLTSEAGVSRDDRYNHISTSALFGVAVRNKDLELDLTSGETRVRRMMEAKRKDLTMTGILAAAVIMLSSVVLMTNIFNKSAYQAQLKKKIAQVASTAEEIERTRAMVNVIGRRLDPGGSSINMLAEISKLTPLDITLTVISIEEKRKAVLKGRAPAMSNVFRFVTALEDSGIFTGVKPTYTTTQKDQAGDYAEFEITCSYESAK